MTTFALTTTLLSLVIFAVFIIIGIRKFGLLGSYSAYSSKWTEAVPLHNVNIWSIVTVIVAMLLAPALIEQGEGNPWQCLGFFAPIYLIVVAMTPRWETDKKQKCVHVIGAALCALIALLWLALVRHQLWLPVVTALAAWCAGYATVTAKKSLVFWAEMAAFSAVYVSLLIG